MTMLPPVDPTALSANPKFETLYRDLCANKLNPDGSSALDEKVQKERNLFATVSNLNIRKYLHICNTTSSAFDETIA